MGEWVDRRTGELNRDQMLRSGEHRAERKPLGGSVSWVQSREQIRGDESHPPMRDLAFAVPHADFRADVAMGTVG
jgi:hypothetical protein